MNILRIAVSASFRKKDIGKILLAEVEKWARDTGAYGIRLVSGATRIGAILKTKNSKISKKCFESLFHDLPTIGGSWILSVGITRRRNRHTYQ
jgi:GNAT superfamily N-acetyltransferase